MKSNSLLIILCVLLNTQVYGAKFERKLDRFDKVVVTTGVDVELVYGDEYRAEVEVSGIPSANVITVVKNGALRVTLKKELVNNPKSVFVKVRVYCRDIRDVHVSTGASIESKEKVFAKELYVNGSTGAKCKFVVSVEELKLRATEGAELYLRGDAQVVYYHALTGGVISASELKGQEVEAKCGIGSKLFVGACEQLKARSVGGLIIYERAVSLMSKETLNGRVCSRANY